MRFVSCRMCLSAVAVALIALPSFAAVPGASSRPPEADKVHLVLLVAGYRDKIGGPCLNDCKAMKVVLEAAFEQDKERVVVHDLMVKNPATGKYYTPKEVLEYLKSMQVGKNDTVVLFHSGHGVIGTRKDPEGSHMLVIDGGTINRMDMQRIVEQKDPRAIIYLTDCCSGFRGPQSAEGGRDDMPKPNIDTVRNLMLRPVGIISITAADDGTLAIASYKGANPGKAGSAFTVALLRLWYDQKVTFTSWEQMFPKLRDETAKASGGRHKARAFQVADYQVLAGGTVVLPFNPRADANWRRMLRG